MKKYLTTAQAAEIRGVSQQTVLSWIKHKTRPLRSIKAGEGRRAQYLISPVDLNNYKPNSVGTPKRKEK